jgi:glycosyltransferase involved in cell wall biosynthesis
VKVLHVDTARGWRGGQNQVLLTALAMAERGHDVVVACRKGEALHARAREARLETRGLWFGGDASPAGALGLARLVRAFGPDVLHLHDPHALGAALLAPSPPPRVASRRVDFPLRGALSRWKYRRCHRVIAVSRAVARVLERDGLGNDLVRVVYEGVPDRPPAPGGKETLASLGVPREAVVVGSVAAFTDHKDHRTLIAAAARVAPRVPSAWFVLLGEGEREADLRRQVKASGLERRVVFGGFRTDLDRLIPAFDVFCLSSWMEGLGTSLLDAMCYGRAVVATAAGGIPEAVEDGVTGRVVPVRDPEGLAGALADVLQDPARRAALGDAGRRRFLEAFTAERMVERTLAVYGEVA